jgi:tungstate transport system substrate-binding protein
MIASKLAAVCAVLVAAAAPACARPELEENQRALRLATSYSVGDSGLFPVLERAFRAETGLPITASFVGSAAALTKGRRGEADVVLVHERGMEDAFVEEGFGLNRCDVMHSDFLIVGPRDDPAGVRGLTSAVEALAALASKRAAFFSRADDSGNHVRERSLWQLAGIVPEAPWYEETRAGMLATLKRASERGGYTLVDRPTYLSNRRGLALDVVVAGDSRLYNAYGVMAVNPLKVDGVNYDGAVRFMDFLTGPKAAAVIRDFGRAEFGEPLFVPVGDGG